MRNKKLLVVAIFVAFSLVACGLVLFLTADKGCNHEWLDATCSAPKTCKLCQATEGTALGHTGGVADCVSGAECTRCGEEYGEAGAHAYNQQAVKPEALKSAATCQSAAVYYKSCACGLVSTNENDTFTFGDALAHTFDREVTNENTLKTEATCQSAAVYYKSCVCGAVSESNLDVFTSGELGAHVYDQINVNVAALKSPATCENAAVYYKSCICGAVSSNDADVFEDGDTVDHRYTLVGSTVASCTHGATNTYRCDVCDDEYTDDVGVALGHDISGVTPVEKAVEGSSCKFVIVYTCKRTGCGAEVEEGTIERHNYIARITQEATCAEDGVKTYTCICGDSYTEVIPKNETSHNWIKGVVTLGTRTDSCSVCGTTKSVTVYEGNKTESTNTNDLKDKEIEINDANINLGGDVLDAIGDKEVTISADKIEGDDKFDLGLSVDQLSQVGDNPIYNFTINDGNENISQFGEDNYVTITLPYTLSEGEDVDSIAIWFINDDGELETIKATYSNGYVTFKTNHFSYYTVTRLTPAERCALYGHSYTHKTQEATCTKDGYDLHFCVRCHDQYKDNEVEALGHKFVETRTEPTCTKAGNLTYTCEHCNYSYKTRLSATGHNYVSIENVDATCKTNGYEKFECDGCGKTYTTNKNKLSHEIEQIIVEATCDREGHTLNKCKNCDYSYANNYTAALGHDYALEGWTWSEDYSSATLKFVCRHDETHTVTREANISVSITRSPCSEFYIKTVYTATVLYNGQMYEDTKETEKGSASHVFGTEWKFDDKEHWHECACGEKADVTEHTFENETVTKEPTCAENGEKTAYCSCGAEHKTEIEALGHDFIADETKESTCAEEGYTKYVCSDCGEEKIETIEKVDHDITDTVVDPTCTEGGYTLHECKNCDYSVKDSETAPVGHSHIPNVTAPTCTEKGYTTYTCVCGDSYVDEYVDVIPHNFVEVERKDSTCAEEGFIKYGCSACDEERVEALPKLAHDLVDTVVAPTCTEGGYTVHECKNCDYSAKDSETAAKGHDFVDTVVEPTCTDGGYTIHECKNCGYRTKDSETAAKGHDFVDTAVEPTCTDGGYTIHECKNCDYRTKDSETEATGHKYSDTVTAPTCTEKGYTTHTCACGESYVDSYVKETGHKYTDFVAAPTCTEKGFTTHTCACGETYVDTYVDATGHTESDWIVDEQATTEKEGLKHTECTVCKVTIKEEKIPVVIEGLEFTLNPDKKSYSVTGIGTYKGTEIVIPETHEGLPVIAIGNDAFSNNKDITSVVIPSSVTLIGENAFKNCDGIVEVKLPAGVVTVSDNAFFACKALKNIEIPNSVTSIGVMAFSNCGALEYIHFIGNENEWNAIEKGKDWDKGAGKHVIDFEFEVIVPHEHKYEAVVTAPTCTQKGYTTYTCECGDTYVDNYVDATGHNYEAVVTAPTCKENGYTTYTCACGDTYVDNYVDAAHSYKAVVTAPTCTEQGYTTYTCACGDTYVDNYVDATGHAYEAVVTAPTCKEKGYTTYTCACGDTYVGNYVDATGHIYVDGVCSGCGRGENDCDHTELHEEKIDLSEYGTCEFYFTVATCECGEVKYLVDGGDSECDLENGETEYIYNDNGQIIGMRATTSCSACGITIYAEMFQEVNGCIETTVINYVFSINEEVILDGLSMREDYERHSYEKAEIDLSKYDGCCGGTLYVSMCKDCGKVEYVEDLESKCNFDLDTMPTPEEVVGKDGIIHYIYSVECPDCGFSVVLEEWTEVYSVCEKITFMNYKVSFGEEIIAEYTESNFEDNHEWKTTYELEEGSKSCEDGIKVTDYCSLCETSHTYTNYYHVEREWNVTIDLSEYTECGGSARVDRCKLCGEVTYLHDISFNCDFAEGVEEDILNENGEVCGSKVTFTCKNCGIIATQSEWIENESECESYEYSQLQIFVDGKCVLEYLDEEYMSNHQYEYTYEIEEGKTCEDGCKVTVKCTVCGYYYTYNTTYHNTRSETINFADHGACGGSASISRCMACNTVTNCNLWENSGCDLETVTEDIFDDNGEKLGTRTVQICSECGLTIVTESKFEISEKCELITYTATNISINNEEILAVNNTSYWGAAHKYERTYEFDGEPNCLSEYTVIDTCTICGYENRWTNSGHMTEYFEHDLTEYGACKGYVRGYHCSICDQITELDDFDICYDINNPEFIEEKTDEDGNVHVIAKGTCENCNLTFEIEQWIMQEECLITGKAVFSIYSGETLLYSFTFVQTEARHDIQYKYELLGKVCNEGVQVIETCSNCDYYYERTYWGHKIAWKYVELADYGLCGGYVELATCEFCEETVSVNWNTKCAWYYVETREDGWVIENCKRCGAERHYLVADGEKDENCNYLHTETNVFYIDGVEVYKFTYSQNYGGHNWEYTYEFEGEPNCQNQYKVIETCTECGYSDWWYTSGHRTEWFELNLSDYGACYGYIEGEHCEICNKITQLYNFDLDCTINDPDTYEEITGDDGLPHTIMTGNCSNCSVTYTIDIWNVAESVCVNVENVRLTLYLDDVCLFDYTEQSWHEQHDYQRSYEFLGETCKDGIKVTEYCTKCDNYNEWTTYDHALEEEYIYLEEYGMCGGYVCVTKCVACDYQDSWYNNYCSWSYIGKNDDGLDVYECTNCGALRYTETVAGEKNENCYIYGTYNHTIYKDGVEIAKYSQSFGTSVHNYKYEYTMYGESCEDGWLYKEFCEDCGYVIGEYEYYSHERVTVEYIDFSNYGACYGYYQYSSCPCGENTWEGNNYCFDHSENTEGYDENGNYYTLYTASCSTCGLVYTSKTVRVENAENCTCTLNHTKTVVIGENEFVLKSETSEYQNHSFKDVEYTVSNGLTTIVSVCETCGYSNRFESQKAVLEADENGDYYYDFIFTPEETGTYHIFGLGNTFTWVNLYQLVDGELIQLKYDNAGGQDYNFYLSYTLTVGVTYVYRIDYRYENKEGIIDYCFGQLDSLSCDHSHNTVFKFMTDSENCNDGVRRIELCEYCGRIEYIEERYDHVNYNVYSYEINSSDCGAYHYLGVNNCPCGYEFSISTNLDWNEETQSYACNECGLIASRITEWIEDGCIKYLVTQITVTRGEEELFSREERIPYSNHNFSDLEYIENGEDVSIIYGCSKCDEVQTFEMNQAVLEDNGAGEFYYDLTFIPEESANYIISSMTSGDTYVILYQIIDGEYIEIGRNDDGGYNNNFRLTSWLEEGNTYVYRIRFYSSSKSGTINYVLNQVNSQHTQNSNLPCSHNSTYLVTLLPGSKYCNEGAFRVDICTYCGYLHSFTSENSHFTTQIERVDLEQIGACHGYFYIYSCACGEENGINLNNFCYDSYTRSDYPIKDENGNWVYSGVYSCSTCGLEVSYSYYDARNHQTCQLIRYYNVTVSINGEVALTRHYEMAHTSHDYELSFDMYGKTCEDGYKEIYTCADCGDSYEGSEYYHHNNYYIQVTQPYAAWENPVYCSGHSVNVYSCACGYEFYHNVWGMDWDSELQGYNCNECGLSVYETEEWVEDGCTRYFTDTIVVNFGDEEWYNDFRTVEYENHNFVNNEYVVNGDNKCIISTCDRCDETKTIEIKQADIAYQEDGHYYYDFTFTPEENGEYTIMSIGDKNTYVELYRLVDGELQFVSSNSWGANYENFKLSYRLEVGTTYVYRVSYYGVEESGTIDYIFESRVNNNLCNHYTVYFSQLIEGAETCDEGCYYGSICKYCADLSNIREVYDHNSINKDYLDLDSLGACYGYYYFNSCACGESHEVYIYSCYDSYEHTSEYDENGNLVNIHTRSCSTCGLSYVRSYYTVRDRDNCKLHYYYTVTIMIGDEIVLEKEYEVAKTQHDYLASFEMYGETCYDGYLVTYTCSDCGDSYEYGESFYHNEYRVYTINPEELGCCEGHSLYVEACPCGYYFNYYYDGLSNNAEDPERYYCDDCELAFRYTYNNVYEGCSRSDNKSISITFGDEELYSLETVVNHFDHSFNDTSAEFIDGAYVINSVCTDCGETRSYSSERVVLTDEDADGKYTYSFELSVDETKEYYLRFFDDTYKYVYIYRLVNGEREYYYSNSGSNNFSVSPTLYAEDTYIVEIYAYTDEDVVVDFFMTEKYVYGANCSHGYLSFGCLLEGSETCEDGTLRGSICYQCGRITSIYKENYHNTYLKEQVNLSDYGACYGNYSYYECACGDISNVNYNMCAYNYSGTPYYDDQGRLINITTRTCSSCGLRYDHSYYTVKDTENCTLTYYYTDSITINGELIIAKSYTSVEESHDYEITAEFMEGSTSCEQGVNITRTCKDCGDTLTYSEYYHNQYAKETIDLEQYGSVCKGYATVVGCVCGKYNDLYLDNVICDFDEEYCLLWIENVADKNQWDMSGYWRGFSNYAYIYTCAVTDPDQCAFKMRYATYWLKDEDSCVAYRYETYQFGYDEDTGACAYEITYKTGEYSTYHNYVETIENNSTHYDCPDCGSYYYQDYYYFEDGSTEKYEKKILNATDNGDDKYYELIREYDYDSNGSHYQSRDYEKRIYADDTEWFRESTRTPYVGTFGKPGWEVKSTSRDRYGYENEEHHAYVYLSGFESSGYEYSNWEYYIFRYYSDGSNWQKYDYTYSFDGECIRTMVYTDNNGANETTVENYCRMYRTEYLESPTCTQDGTYRHQCVICQGYSESYVSNPIGHAWAEINNEWHYCLRCGLENANGADGTIIMSDLTEGYGNGENYVVGYWNQGNVRFTQYVSIILENGEEIILEGIEFSEIEGLRTVVFGKAAVEAAASELGYSADEYLVRFAFVPYGADSTLDYAITFTETFDFENAAITDDINFKQYIGAGETVSFTITPTEDTVWTFTSAGSYDTYGYLYNAEGNLLDSDDDGGENTNFLITYTLSEGETYTVSVRWYHSDTTGYMPLIFDCTPVAE